MRIQAAPTFTVFEVFQIKKYLVISTQGSTVGECSGLELENWLDFASEGMAKWQGSHNLAGMDGTVGGYSKNGMDKPSILPGPGPCDVP